MNICITLPNWTVALLIGVVFYVLGFLTTIYVGWRIGKGSKKATE